MSVLLFGSYMGGLPPPPTRDELLGGQCSFQGISLSDGYKLFDPEVGWPGFDHARRLDAYRSKREDAARRGKPPILCLTLSGRYYSTEGRDYSRDLPALASLVVEALTEGGMRGIWLMLAGDGESKPDRTYNDPNGWTYGFDWLMENFERVHDGLRDLAPYIVWIPGFDGVVPVWQPWNKVNRWLTHARSVVGPSGHLGLELGMGYWCWSGEHDDYATGAGRELDLVLQEFPFPMGPPDSPAPADFCNQSNETRAPWDQVWQISKRLLGPLWRRPAHQPACDDQGMAGTPGGGPTARGPLFVNAFEYDTYGWDDMRNLVTETDVERHRAYLQSLGWSNVG